MVTLKRGGLFTKGVGNVTDEMRAKISAGVRRYYANKPPSQAKLDFERRREEIRQALEATRAQLDQK